MAVAMVKLLEALRTIAPLELAEDWDNVGLLIEGPKPRRVRRCLLTIDLTDAVLQEAIAAKAELVVAYHPPIFAGLKRLRMSEPREQLVLNAVRAKIAVYSPHTALDSTVGGVNDWLANAFGQGERRPIRPNDPTPGSPEGQGRLVTLSRSTTLTKLVRRIKQHLGLRRVRLAAAKRHEEGESLKTVALCAGAGGSVLAGVGADLYLTGEMRHHDILAANERGTSVVVCDHTNTERGYLDVLRERLEQLFAGVEFAVAVDDADPLTVV